MAFRLVGSEVAQLSAAQLFDEFQQLVLSGRAGVWSLASHYIQPPLFKELFDCIRFSGLHMPTPVAIDLDDNRLNAGTVEDFKAMLQAMQAPGLDRLLVRLGFEIFVPHLKEAMAELDMQHVYNERVFVNLPWESGTMALSKKLSENTLELQKSNSELQKSNSILQKMLGATEKRLRVVELLERKDPAEELAQMRAYNDTDAHLVEECVSNAVAAVLDDAVIVHPTKYIFKGRIGDLDGMVVGVWRGQEVVVLVEAKHNMDTCASKARTELLSAGAYWKELAEMEG
eukprot:362819-Chlamydomonas_euryale.AAC.3